MISPSAAAPAPDETNEAEALPGGGAESRGWPGYVIGGLAIGIAFVLGATLVYRAILAALLHVR